MKYPRTDCPTCKRDVAVYPKAQRITRHDPANGRTEDLKSCPGSFAFHTLDPERYGHQSQLF